MWVLIVIYSAFFSSSTFISLVFVTIVTSNTFNVIKSCVWRLWRLGVMSLLPVVHLVAGQTLTGSGQMDSEAVYNTKHDRDNGNPLSLDNNKPLVLPI